ncbi:MAG TPA: hypothetical protein VMM76_03285 [Pirellulaceae bacterium]|nr:hypothetical protein [Pirellulaceae bacterium]
MKTKSELQPIIDKIASPDSPVGMDAVYVHALILDKLEQLEARLTALEVSCGATSDKTEDVY